jgi:hypothetical protein
MRWTTLTLAAAVVLELTLAGLSPSAAASSLAYQGLALGPGASASSQTVLARGSLASSSERPVRRRRPGSYRVRDYHPSYFVNLGIGHFDPTEQPGSGFYFNGAIGSELGDPIDLGLSIQWYHRSVGGTQIVSEFEDPAGNKGRRVVETSEVTTDLVPVMGFLRVRLPVSGVVQPYVGGGIGWEWLAVEGTDDQGFSFYDDYDGFGAQLFGGANLAVSAAAALYAEATWNASTVSAEFYDPSYGGNVRDEVDMDGLALHGGLRLRF